VWGVDVIQVAGLAPNETEEVMGSEIPALVAPSTRREAPRTHAGGSSPRASRPCPTTRRSSRWPRRREHRRLAATGTCGACVPPREPRRSCTQCPRQIWVANALHKYLL